MTIPMITFHLLSNLTLKKILNECECDNENKQELVNESDLFQNKLIATHTEPDIEVANTPLQ